MDLFETLGKTTKPKKPSQETQILAWLRAGKSLTSMQALCMFNCWSLSQRMTNLRRNWPIHTEMITTNSGKRIAKYTLITK